MMELKAPILTARDVELRVGRMQDNKCTLLAYKDARVDRRILDKLVGPMNWERSHQLIDGQLFCTVSIYDSEKGQWVSKQDVGKESKTEAEKGRASDSFKRACFCWGIGVELYDAPKITIDLSPKEVYNGKLSVWVDFSVKELEYNEVNHEYTKFTVVDQDGKVRFQIGEKHKTDNKPKGENNVQNVTKQLGGTAIDNSKFVRIRNGKYEVYAESVNCWYSLDILGKKQLNDICNDEKYKSVWDVARNLLSQK